MAAGRSTRFGSPKQFTEVGPNAELLLDLEILFGSKVGINEVIIVSNDLLMSKISTHINNRFQDISSIVCNQDTFERNQRRFTQMELYGTGMALMSAKQFVEDNCILVNGDDYYSANLYAAIAPMFESFPNSVGFLACFKLKDTLSANGPVNRAVCTLDSNSNLLEIVETSHLYRAANGEIRDKSGKIYSGEEFVSMNFWGFKKVFLKLVEDEFESYKLRIEFWKNKEFNVPDIVRNFIKVFPSSFKLFHVPDASWAGLTFPDDLETTRNFIKLAKENGDF